MHAFFEDLRGALLEGRAFYGYGVDAVAVFFDAEPEVVVVVWVFGKLSLDILWDFEAIEVVPVPKL